MKIIVIIVTFLIFNPHLTHAELRIDITKGNLDPIPIAILEFNANKSSELDISKNINNVVKNNLERSGLFSVLPNKIFLNDKILFDIYRNYIFHLSQRFVSNNRLVLSFFT